MKKIAVLIASCLLLITISAKAQQVSVMSNNNYDVKIDGRYFNANNVSISNLAPGAHVVQVFEVTRGCFFGLGRRRVLVSSSRFYLGNNDVAINVDEYGQVRVNQFDNMAGRRNRWRNRNYDRNYNSNYDRNRYNQSNYDRNRYDQQRNY